MNKYDPPLSPDEPLLPDQGDGEVEVYRHGDHLGVHKGHWNMTIRCHLTSYHDLEIVWNYILSTLPHLSKRGPEGSYLAQDPVIPRGTLDVPILESRAADLCGPLEGEPPVTTVHLTTEIATVRL